MCEKSGSNGFRVTVFGLAYVAVERFPLAELLEEVLIVGLQPVVTEGKFLPLVSTYQGGRQSLHQAEEDLIDFVDIRDFDGGVLDFGLNIVQQGLGVWLARGGDWRKRQVFAQKPSEVNVGLFPDAFRQADAQRQFAKFDGLNRGPRAAREFSHFFLGQANQGAEDCQRVALW